MQPYPYRHIHSLANAYSGRWTLWYALGLYSFILVVGAFEVHNGARIGYFSLASSVLILIAIAIGRLRMRAMRTLPTAPFDPYAPGWVREMPITPAIRRFARRRQAQQYGYVGLTVVVLAPLFILTDDKSRGHANIFGLIVGFIVALVMLIGLRSTYTDTGSTTYWEAAGPLHGEPIWRMTRAGYALYVGHERLIVTPKAARRIAGEPWGFVTAMRQTAEVIEVRDWYGNVVYRAPGYRP